jgi:hypothetical protein
MKFARHFLLLSSQLQSGIILKRFEFRSLLPDSFSSEHTHDASNKAKSATKFELARCALHSPALGFERLRCDTSA